MFDHILLFSLVDKNKLFNKIYIHIVIRILYLYKSDLVFNLTQLIFILKYVPISMLIHFGKMYNFSDEYSTSLNIRKA